jgi:C-terminal processing protease CtpA/Prc
MYLERTNRTPAPDMDVVGLVLRPEADRRYTIIGVADYDGKPSVPEVKTGDVLVGVDGAPATGATMGQVWSLLGGTPGQVRTLTMEREGKRFTVEATVRRFLAAEPIRVTSPRKNPRKRN